MGIDNNITFYNDADVEPGKREDIVLHMVWQRDFRAEIYEPMSKFQKAKRIDIPAGADSDNEFEEDDDNQPKLTLDDCFEEHRKPFHTGDQGRI